MMVIHTSHMHHILLYFTAKLNKLCLFYISLQTSIHLLLPEYFLLGAVPLLLALLFRLPRLLKQLRKLMHTILLFLAFGGMIVGIHALTGETDYLPNREIISFSLFGRTVWPTIWHDNSEWPQEVKVATADSLWEVSLYADNMQRIFRPLMQERFSEG